MTIFIGPYGLCGIQARIPARGGTSEIMLTLRHNDFNKENWVNQIIYYLSNLYNETTINSILDLAINGIYEIYFLNSQTNVIQPLTMVQLMGIKKFRGVNILLETGQTYQIGLEMHPKKGQTYQEVYIIDLIVNKNTLDRIKNK